jgi:hypothetical protein
MAGPERLSINRPEPRIIVNQDNWHKTTMEEKLRSEAVSLFDVESILKTLPDEDWYMTNWMEHKKQAAQSVVQEIRI